MKLIRNKQNLTVQLQDKKNNNHDYLSLKLKSIEKITDTKNKMQKVILWLRFGVGEWHNIKNGKKMIWPVGSNIGFHDTTAKKCPKHFDKVQCTMHYQLSSMPQASESSVPLAPQKFTAQFSVHLSPLHLVFGVLTSGTGITGFLTHSGLTSLSENRSWASSSQPTSPDVSWAEPLSTMYCLLCTCDSAAHCCIAFEVLVMVQHTARVGLLAILLKSYICCCFLAKRNRFSYNFLVGHQPADLLLTGVLVCLPPTIGPTLGANFVVMGLYHPLQTGVASRALGLQQWTETKAILGCKMDVYLPGPGYGPEDSQLQLENRLYKNEHIMKQW